MSDVNVSPDDIDRFRKEGLQHIVSTLLSYLTLYQSNKFKCPHYANESFACGAAHAGSIVKHCDLQRLLSASGDIYFKGMSVTQAVKQVEAFREPTVWLCHPCNFKAMKKACQVSGMGTTLEDYEI
jgi:hypothetical protein